MRVISKAPNPAIGEDGGGAPVGGSVSRLQMPQVLTVATRPPLGAGPSASTIVTSPTTTNGRATDTQNERHGGGENEPLVPIRGRPPVSTSPATAKVHRKEGSVQVAIRVRPLLPKEMAARVGTCVETDTNTIYIPSNDKTFAFDHVFPMKTDQKDLYEQVVQPMMDPFLQGYNVTVLAYGQTGSGKTYTMGNDSAALVPRLFGRRQPEQPESSPSEVDDHEGVIPRFINEMFTKLQNDKESTTSQVSVSFLEIYGEEIHDLLDQSRGQSKDTLQVRESNGVVWVQGLTEVKVSNFAEATEQMRQGCVQRITASTGMNEHSSRSHAIYTVKLVRKTKNAASPHSGASVENGEASTTKRRGSRRLSSSNQVPGLLDDDESETVVVSKLTFVDLAGSERLKKTQAEGDRMKEGIQINVGLLALGNVITALGDERRRSNPRQHVAYRDSKLTRLLQDALGGNSRTLFIACISPAESNVGETINTLQYASRAKNIQNKAVKNVDPRSAELTRSKVLNDVLRNALAKSLSLVLGGPNTPFLEPDNLVDPSVQEYLRKLEEIAWSIAAGSASSAEAALETSRAIGDLYDRRSYVVPGDSLILSQLPNSSGHVSVSAESSIPLMDCPTSDTSSSVHLENTVRGTNRCVNLRHVCRVLEVVGLTLEMQDLNGKLIEAQTRLEAKIVQLDLELMQKHALIQATELALQKMKTWNESVLIPIGRQDSSAQAVERLQRLKHDAETISCKKDLETNNFTEISRELRSCLEQKQQMIQRVRQSVDSSSVVDEPSPLELMLEITEIKNRFQLRELCDVAWALEAEEREGCELLDDHPDVLAFEKKFFPDQCCTQSQHVIYDIQRNIDSTIVEEDFKASRAMKLRERVSILQRITTGWSLHTRTVTEQEFLTENEQELRLCEENIREISEALRHPECSNVSIGSTIDSINSLDVAKRVIKGLVDVLYSHKRVVLARTRADISLEIATAPANHDDMILEIKKQHEEELCAERDKFAKELASVYDMVKPFGLDSLDQDIESLYAQRQLDTRTIAELKEQARLSNDELQRMTEKMAELHKEVEMMESKFKDFKEYITGRKECTQLAKELGMPEDFAGIDSMMNPAAMKQLREKREYLLARKAEKLQEIEAAYRCVKNLEAALRYSQPMNIDAVRCGHDKALDDQLLAIIYHQSRLAEELNQRVHSQLRVMDSISGLCAELEVSSHEDLQHPLGYDSAEDLESTIDSLRLITILKQVRASPDANAMSKMVSENPSLSDILSSEVLDRNGRVLKALLFEKTNRLAAVERVSNEIRSLVDVMELREDDIKSILQLTVAQNIDEEPAFVNEVTDMLKTIPVVSGHLDITKRLNRLTTIRDSLLEVRDGRSIALSYVHSILEEAEKFVQESEEFALPTSAGWSYTEFGFSRNALHCAVEKLKALLDPPVEQVCLLLTVCNGEFTKYGIEAMDKKIDFLVASQDTDDNPNRKLLEKYFGYSSTSDRTYHCDAGSQNTSLLSSMDPAYGDFANYLSTTFGTERLIELKRAAGEVRQISELFASAEIRFESLRKIMSCSKEVDAMKVQMNEFSTNANKKDRLFGSSTVLMREEKQRKYFAREYPLKLARLRDEVQIWVKNESGDFNLDILGDEMKNHILDMLKTDTHLMHLDVGVLDPSRPSARRSSKTAAGIYVSLQPDVTPNQGVHPNQEATSNTRIRPGSAPAREGSGWKHTGAN